MNRTVFLYAEKQFLLRGHVHRLDSTLDVVYRVLELYPVPDTEFLVELADGSYNPMFPVFASIRATGSLIPVKRANAIPFPIGNYRGFNEGFANVVAGWDTYAEKHHLLQRSFSIPWEKKISKAVWRGGISPQTFAAGEAPYRRAKIWSDNTRARLFTLSAQRPDITDVKFSSLTLKKKDFIDFWNNYLHNHTTDLEGLTITRRNRRSYDVDDTITFKAPSASKIKLADQSQFKYIFSVGNSFDWAERVRVQLHLSSISILQEGPEEFFTPMLKPYVHYLPLAANVSNAIEIVSWAVSNDAEAKQIVENAHQFDRLFLSEEGMIEFAYIAILRYTELLQYTPSASLALSAAQSEVISLVDIRELALRQDVDRHKPVYYEPFYFKYLNL